MNILERKQMTSALLQEKVIKDKRLTDEKNQNITEIVKLEGQLALLTELVLEEQNAKRKEENIDTSTETEVKSGK